MESSLSHHAKDLLKGFAILLKNPLTTLWFKEFDFWLPAVCGGAALEANIDVVVVVGAMSFTQKCLF